MHILLYIFSRLPFSIPLPPCFLTRSAADEQWTQDQAIFAAVTEGDADKITSLIASGHSVNMKDQEVLVSFVLVHCIYIFMYILLLLQHLLSALAADIQGMTPLHYAVDRGNQDIVMLLLDNSADVNSQDACGETPLMLAVICEHEELISLLRCHGADKTIANNDGLTVLDMDGLSEEIMSILK